MQRVHNEEVSNSHPIFLFKQTDLDHLVCTNKPYLEI